MDSATLNKTDIATADEAFYADALNGQLDSGILHVPADIKEIEGASQQQQQQVSDPSGDSASSGAVTAKSQALASNLSAHKDLFARVITFAVKTDQNGNVDMGDLVTKALLAFRELRLGKFNTLAKIFSVSEAGKVAIWLLAGEAFQPFEFPARKGLHNKPVAELHEFTKQALEAGKPFDALKMLGKKPCIFYNIIKRTAVETQGELFGTFAQVCLGIETAEDVKKLIDSSRAIYEKQQEDKKLREEVIRLRRINAALLSAQTVQPVQPVQKKRSPSPAVLMEESDPKRIKQEEKEDENSSSLHEVDSDTVSDAAIHSRSPSVVAHDSDSE